MFPTCTLDHVLLKIREPKTRFRSARQQTGKLEQLDLIAVVTLGLGNLTQDGEAMAFIGIYAETSPSEDLGEAVSST